MKKIAQHKCVRECVCARGCEREVFLSLSHQASWHTLSLPLSLFIFCQNWGTHGPLLIGAGRVTGGKWEIERFFSKVLARWFLLWGIFLGPPPPEISSPTLNCQTRPMASPAYPPINSRSHSLEFLTTCNWIVNKDYIKWTKNTTMTKVFVTNIVEKISRFKLMTLSCLKVGQRLFLYLS